MVTPAAAVAAGLGLSAWIIYLDYLRRFRPGGPGATARPGTRTLNAGLVLVAAGLATRQVTGIDTGWTAVACVLSVVSGIALVAIYVTRTLAAAFDDDGGRRR